MSVCIFRSWLQLLSSLTYNYTESGISTKNRFTDLILHLQIQIPELLDRLENSLFMVVGSLSHLKQTKSYILNAIFKSSNRKWSGWFFHRNRIRNIFDPFKSKSLKRLWKSSENRFLMKGIVLAHCIWLFYCIFVSHHIIDFVLWNVCGNCSLVTALTWLTCSGCQSVVVGGEGRHHDTYWLFWKILTAMSSVKSCDNSVHGCNISKRERIHRICVILTIN